MMWRAVSALLYLEAVIKDKFIPLGTPEIKSYMAMVGSGGCRPPRQPTHPDRWCLEFNGILSQSASILIRACEWSMLCFAWLCFARNTLTHFVI
jgi:hypothetical protein